MRFIKIIWNFFAVLGFVLFVGVIASFMILSSGFKEPVKDYGKRMVKVLDAYVFNKPLKPVKNASIILPEYNFESWKGHGARRDRLLKPILFYKKRQPIPEEWEKYTNITSVTHQQKKRKTNNVKTSKELLMALNSSMAGDFILISPGKYRISTRAIYLKGYGDPTNPIVVSGGRLGDVTLELDSYEGFFVDKPFWCFENLIIKGIRENHDACEHAFHVVGDGMGFVLRNNIIFDFNSIVKVNGSKIYGGKIYTYPDYGLIEECTFYNSEIRRTSKPVNAIDIVGGDFWTIRGNFIFDFAKGMGDKISYAAFVKGNSTGGVFENNLVIGEYRHSGGTRVGLSFGGGGTGKSYSRGFTNEMEHSNGIIRNNIIMYFNDVGIYLNKSLKTKIFNNNILYSSGIDVRFNKSSAIITNNIIDSEIRKRDGGEFKEMNNFFLKSKLMFFGLKHEELFENPLYCNFKLKKKSLIVDKGKNMQELYDDIFGNKREFADIGAIEYPFESNILLGEKK